MQDLVRSGEISLHFFPCVFDLINELAQLLLINVVVDLLLLSHTFPAADRGIKLDCTLLLLI